MRGVESRENFEIRRLPRLKKAYGLCQRLGPQAQTVKREGGTPSVVPLLGRAVNFVENLSNSRPFSQFFLGRNLKDLGGSKQTPIPNFQNSPVVSAPGRPRKFFSFPCVK